MPGLRLIISDAEINESGILIKSIDIIDSETGEVLRPSKLTPELLEFIKSVEIDIDKYFNIQDMKKKNPVFKTLVDSFKLFT